MEDHAIIELYWQRQESAIQETAAKYGAFLSALARNILRSEPDAEECVNDTYLRAWNAI
ncbi:MAG: RNA polymerase subunit sigma-70, partial [Oscillibacter sp.]|nr:RNA polymerase subunit sigma-70 [Oscillibacter sp.]